jgi:multidrug efflux pump subunit AcrB
MVKFLIHRPIAVSMCLLAMLVLGSVSLSYIPVSLMPETNIPEIYVQLEKKNASARELEDAVVSPLRRQLMQVSHLSDIRSESRDEQAVIRLKLEYGTDINLAFLEVNEMIDRAMNSFPRDIKRPKAIKASVTDIPVFYLNLSLKEEGGKLNAEQAIPISAKEESARTLNQDQIKSGKQAGPASAEPTLFPVSQQFVELSRFASMVIRKRLEQMPAVAMVDMSGQVYSELLVIPDIPALESLGIDLEQLESSIRNSNVNLGSLLVQDGQYQYNVRFNSFLKNKRDIENIFLKKDERLIRLKNVAAVVEHPQKRKGMVTSDGKDALTLAIIKKAGAQMGDLQNSLDTEIDRLRQTYPHINFSITRDQTLLLDYSIANLGQSLLWGAGLAFLIMFLFLRDFKSPLLIGITIPASILISLLLFHLFNLSINIISLSGLVLGVGMMIDNSIIVIDNITQLRERKRKLNEACVVGVNEVIRPMLSSVLTTCAVFIPLIFAGGIAGTLFYDQAMAVGIGLFVSLIISVTALPVYYRLFYLKEKKQGENKWLQKLNGLNYEGLYEKGFRFIMRRQAFVWAIVGLSLLGVVWLYESLPKTRLPAISRDEIVLRIDWNEKIHVNENNRRLEVLLEGMDSLLVQHTCLIGEQQFLLGEDASAGSSEAMIYLKAKSPAALKWVQNLTQDKLKIQYREAAFKFEEAVNIFNLILSDDEPSLEVRLRARADLGPKRNELLKSTLADLEESLPLLNIKPVSWQEHSVLIPDPVKLMAYDIPVNTLFNSLKSSFNEWEIMMLSESQEFIPVIMGGEPRLFNEVLRTTFVSNRDGKAYPLRDLISEDNGYDLKTIVAGQEGEYYPLALDIEESNLELITESVKKTLGEKNFFEAEFTGNIFSRKELMGQLLVIVVISLSLLYCILAAQFESLTLPLIVLLEVPIDIFGALFFLKLFGNSINLMSMIGIVVMSGIIINDSILKIDTINQLRQEGNSLLRALLEAGRRRLKPILMTSLTTILALLPLVFTTGLGAELQLPLALSVIGGMTFGTLVSLYFIPLFFYYLKRDKPRGLNRRG